MQQILIMTDSLIFFSPATRFHLQLYINRGNFRFEEVTEKAGVQTVNWATGVSVADINNDGLPDMYISYRRI